MWITRGEIRNIFDYITDIENDNDNKDLCIEGWEEKCDLKDSQIEELKKELEQCKKTIEKLNKIEVRIKNNKKKS